jgi:hypothetical protein
MQLIVAGASGFLATEVIRQSLYLPKITSVIALARRSVSAPSGLGADADASKLQSVVIKDYDDYPDEVKKQFANADACIWYSPSRSSYFCCMHNFLPIHARTVAVTPSKSRSMDFKDVQRICQDYTLIGLKAMTEARSSATTPFRFMYLSGVAAERDQTKTPTFMAQYSWMRVSHNTRNPGNA